MGRRRTRTLPMEQKAGRTRNIEHAAFPLVQIKSLDNAQGIFEGYLAAFNNKDDNDDIIEPGAFKKTLESAYEIKKRNSAAFLFPLLWMHEDREFPAGGFTDMSEDSHGLYVKGLCDLDTEIGRSVFSGMQKGYINGLSIGYSTIKASRDTKGVRHLLELRLWEGSAITTGYQANSEAIVLQTKARRKSESKAASGKTSWPLAGRDDAWDDGAAHGRIVAWATDSDGNLDTGKMNSVHFWHADDPSQIGDYKLLFCDVSGDTVKAIPRAIFACTGAHGIQAVQGVSSDDMSTIKGKISTYYKRMAKEFDDDSIVPPWEEKRAAMRTALLEQKMSGLQTLTYGMSCMDDYGDMIDSWLERIGDTVGMNLDPDEGYEDMDVGEQLATSVIPGTAVHPSISTLLNNLSGLKEALLTLGNAFQAFDDATDAVLDLLGMTPVDYSAPMYGFMGLKPQLEVKVSKALSAANRKTIQGVMDGMREHHKALGDMMEKNDPTSGKSVLPPMDIDGRQPERKATTGEPSTGEPEPGTDTDTTLQDLVDEMKLSQLTAMFKQ